MKNFEQRESPQGKPVASCYLDRLPHDLVKSAVQATKEKFGVNFGPAHIQPLSEEQLTFFAQQLFPDKQINRATYVVEKGTNGYDYFFIQGFED